MNTVPPRVGEEMRGGKRYERELCPLLAAGRNAALRRTETSFDTNTQPVFTPQIFSLKIDLVLFPSYTKHWHITILDLCDQTLLHMARLYSKGSREVLQKHSQRAELKTISMNLRKISYSEVYVYHLNHHVAFKASLFGGQTRIFTGDYVVNGHIWCYKEEPDIKYEQWGPVEAGKIKTNTYESQTFSAKQQKYHKIAECLATAWPKHLPKHPPQGFRGLLL